MYLRENGSTYSCLISPSSHPMFLSWLSSSFLPHCKAILSRLPRFIPAPHPWWSEQGFHPWHPRLPQRVFGTRTLHSGTFSGSFRSVYTTAGLMMERPDRDRGPPYKRRKSAEERSVEEREGRRAAVTGGTTHDGRREHQDPRERHRRPHQHCTDERRDGGRIEAGRNVDRTNYWNKNRPWKDGTSQDQTPNKKRDHWQEGRKDPQTAASRTQTLKSRPEQEPKPNPWFKDRDPGKEQQHHRNKKGPEETLRDKSGDVGQGRGLLPQPSNATRPSNPWQVAGASRQPHPPGSSPSDGQWDEATSVKREFVLQGFKNIYCSSQAEDMFQFP